jgi:hypothetical protein
LKHRRGNEPNVAAAISGSRISVIPAKAGIHSLWIRQPKVEMDSRFRGKDDNLWTWGITPENEAGPYFRTFAAFMAIGDALAFSASPLH